MDLASWNGNKFQGFSLVARARDFGPGMTDGYSLGYVTDGLVPGESGLLAITRLDNETSQFINLTTSFSSVVLDPAIAYRLVFSGNGADFTGQVFDLNNLAAPLATVTATDSTYPDGFVGLLSTSATSDGVSYSNDGTDITFDNFTAVPEPGSIMLTALGCLGLLRRNRKS